MVLTSFAWLLRIRSQWNAMNPTTSTAKTSDLHAVLLQPMLPGLLKSDHSQLSLS